MKKFIQQLRKDERGLTLVELLAVIVILGIIATIAFVSIGNVIENSKEDAHVANAMQAIAAAKLKEASSSQEFPTDGYSTKAAETDENYLDTLDTLVNPWSTDTLGEYGAIVQKNGSDYYVTMEGNDNDQLQIKMAPESEVIKGRDGNLQQTEIPNDGSAN